VYGEVQQPCGDKRTEKSYSVAMFNDCIIMAGGSGTRLWPASTAARPKQFLPVSRSGTQTFFSSAVERAFVALEPNGRLIVIAAQRHIALVAAECASFDQASRKRIVLIPEPESKNTAAAIACGVRYVALHDHADRSIVVLTSDHLIAPLAVFKANAEAAFAATRQNALVTFGIKPSRPETGYGYIEIAECLSGSAAESRRFNVASFHEKPDRATAERFIAAGSFYWNSGMFAFTAAFIMSEFERLAPDVYLPFSCLEKPSDYAAQHDTRVISAWTGLADAYHAARRVSFDYAIAERCSRRVMIAADFAWRDIGSWDEYAELVGDSGADVYATGAESCFVDADIPVALCGVKDLIVVVRSGKNGGAPAVLVAKKGQTQGLRDIVDQINDAGKTEFF
jgi:mannose-1-phosphate guanylyltransferase/mannose-6-phosphate isomerase